MELIPLDDITLVSDRRITSDIELAIAVSFISKFAVEPVKLSELQF